MVYHPLIEHANVGMNPFREDNGRDPPILIKYEVQEYGTLSLQALYDGEGFHFDSTELKFNACTIGYETFIRANNIHINTRFYP